MLEIQDRYFSANGTSPEPEPDPERMLEDPKNLCTHCTCTNDIYVRKNYATKRYNSPASLDRFESAMS